MSRRRDNETAKNKAKTHQLADRKRCHLPAAERERQIVEAAASFFAERGFEGQTRELAKTMAITHSAIFRYFPSKEALIERVYEHVFLSRWDPRWKGLIVDRSQPLEARLIRFYREYTERIFDSEWVRIFIFSGLKGHSMTRRYVKLVRDQLIRSACAELRAELGLAPVSELPISTREEEAFWGLHGTVFYIAIRKFIYCVPVPGELNKTIEDSVRGFLTGMATLAPECCRTEAAK